MAEYAVPIITGFFGLLGNIVQNDRNNNEANIQRERENMQRDYNEKINQMDNECNRIIQQKDIEFERQKREIQSEYEAKINIIENEKNQIKYQLDITEKEKREQKETMKEEIRKTEEKYEKEIKQMKEESEKNEKLNLEEKRRNEQKELENKKLEDSINILLRQGSEKDFEYNNKFLLMKKEKDSELENQRLEKLKWKEKNDAQMLENEEQIKKNKIEIDNITKKNKEAEKKEKERYKKLEKEKKEEEENKQKKEKMQRQKDENNKKLAEKLFKEKSINIKNQFIEKLKNKILQKNFFAEILDKYNNDEIMRIIEEIINNLDLKKILDEKTKTFLNEAVALEVNPDMNHLNILLLGPTGSGKSTLINVLLELEGKDCAEVGDDNNPKTMDFKAYTSKKKKYIRCFDSRGVEKSKEYDLDEFIKNSKNLILKQLEKNNPDEYIHIILYCFEGNRFIDEVRDSLYKLMDLYNDEKLPIILVHTRGVQGEEDEELLDDIREVLKKENRKIDIINICAQQDDDYPPFGIDELYSLMISKVKQSVKSACFSSVQNKVKDNFIKVNVDYKNNFQQEFEKIVINEMKNIKLNSNINEQKKRYLKIFSKNIFEKILFDNKNKLNKECIKFLENYLNIFFKWIIQKSEEYMNNFIRSNSNELISDLLNLQHEINSKYDNKLQIQKNTDEWKEEIDKQLKIALDNVIVFGLMKEGSLFIYDEFNKILLDIMEKKYNEYLQTENEYITNVTKDKVEAILNNFVFS